MYMRHVAVLPVVTSDEPSMLKTYSKYSNRSSKVFLRRSKLEFISNSGADVSDSFWVKGDVTSQGTNDLAKHRDWSRCGMW